MMARTSAVQSENAQANPKLSVGDSPSETKGGPFTGSMYGYGTSSEMCTEEKQANISLRILAVSSNKFNVHEYVTMSWRHPDTTAVFCQSQARLVSPDAHEVLFDDVFGW